MMMFCIVLCFVCCLALRCALLCCSALCCCNVQSMPWRCGATSDLPRGVLVILRVTDVLRIFTSLVCLVLCVVVSISLCA